jgi:hypothetical protein
VAALSTDGEKSEGAGMSLWRIRITMADDVGSHEALTAALAEQRVWSLLLVPRDTEMTADVIIELPSVGGLDALLGELHVISPQVFVSSADEPSSLAAGQPVPEQASATPVLQ